MAKVNKNFASPQDGTIQGKRQEKQGQMLLSKTLLLKKWHRLRYP